VEKKQVHKHFWPWVRTDTGNWRRDQNVVGTRDGGGKKNGVKVSKNERTLGENGPSEGQKTGGGRTKQTSRRARHHALGPVVNSERGELIGQAGKLLRVSTRGRGRDGQPLETATKKRIRRGPSGHGFSGRGKEGVSVKGRQCLLWSERGNKDPQVAKNFEGKLGRELNYLASAEEPAKRNLERDRKVTEGP